MRRTELLGLLTILSCILLPVGVTQVFGWGSGLIAASFLFMGLIILGRRTMEEDNQ